ncbi:NarK/NasA family nitrate transporter [Hoyosella rhizosphaerae]|uniref:MFS transporter n=1 Tax=Hoyosella rhizosphaerae TaxID=1755582 RepID=A0A916UB64_9ACTN|nr:nitrate/nitrite transporter [Hoyosella rhizosphaerae]MBN4925965.1 NarK/NasA family nitrate transporter [Hoyosella rhizosphaerae]GGC66595.1 MFS transporter [Hoyosella rhizosphaerae]
MTLISDKPANDDSSVVAEAVQAPKGGRWIDHWEPEDPEFWETTGKKVARRNLWFSVFAENIGFSVWVLFSVLVTQMGNAGFAFMQGDQAVNNGLILVSIPVLVGAAMRIPYTFAVTTFGGRAFTTFSAGMLLIPTLGLAVAFTQPTTPMWVFMILAALAGFGGGNFSSSMANISFFFPESKKGAALGINAAGGNLGVAVTQLAIPLVIAFGLFLSASDPAGYRFALVLSSLFWVPFIVAAALGAWLRMDSLSNAKPDGESYALAMRNRNTWIMAFLYIGTFGSFIGFSFAFPTLIRANFPDLQNIGIMVALGNLAFLGALVGSFSRPFGGWLADRIGSGARLTALVFVGLAFGVAAIMASLAIGSFALYLLSFIVLFVITGIGNGSTYRMIPTIFAASARSNAEANGHSFKEATASGKRQAGAAIGMIGAVGAFGGFILQQALRLSNVHLGTMAPAFWAYAGIFLLMAGVTWWFYLRTSFAISRAPSMAYAQA